MNQRARTLVRQYTELQKLNVRILNKLIEEIVVHEKERDEASNTAQQVDTYCKFIAYINLGTMMGKFLAAPKN